VNSLTISVEWMVFFSILPLIYSIVILAAVALGGFLVYRTKRGEDSSLFGLGQPKVGGATIARGGPNDYGVFGDAVDDDIEDGTDVDSAMKVIAGVNDRFRSQFNATKGGK